MDVYGEKLNNDANIAKFSGVLKAILQDELKAGNAVADSTIANDGTVIIALKHQFKTPVRHFDNIEFNIVEKSDIWHSEYYDKAKNLMLVCYSEQPSPAKGDNNGTLRSKTD